MPIGILNCQWIADGSVDDDTVTVSSAKSFYGNFYLI